MNAKLSVPSVLVGLCCLGILMAAYMPDDLPLVFVESYGEWSEGRDSDNVARVPPCGGHVYHLTRSKIYIYKSNTDSGKLEVVRPTFDSELDGDQRGSCFSDDGSTLFTSAMALDVPNVVVVGMRSRDKETGILTRIAVQHGRLLPQPLLTHIHGICCSGDGRSVYATALVENLLLSFHRSGDELTLGQIFQDDDSKKVFFNGDYLPQWIKGAEVIEDMYQAKALLISPDDRYVYVAAAGDASLTIFQRDTTTGRLTLFDRATEHYNRPEQKLAGGAPEMGLGDVQALAFSPAADHIYSVSNGISTFHRDADTGKVTFVQLIRVGADAIPSLSLAKSVVVSKSGRHVFVAATGDSHGHRGAITIFTRDATTGELKFLKVVDRKEVAGACHLSLSPDGRHLYVSTCHETLAVFAVNENPSEPAPIDPTSTPPADAPVKTVDKSNKHSD
ncbi:MAG: hypothetical protein ABI614_18140 [Planctomycetota bacterium]